MAVFISRHRETAHFFCCHCEDAVDCHVCCYSLTMTKQKGYNVDTLMILVVHLENTSPRRDFVACYTTSCAIYFAY